MRKHPDSRRLSGFLDGDLDRREIQELEEHLAGCQACASLLQDLTDIRERARELPDLYPTRDLWPDIARALGEETAGDPNVIRLHPDSPLPYRTRRRKIQLSLPQAAAAGFALALLSGMAGARIGDVASSQRPAGVAESGLGVEASWVSLVREAKPALESTAMEVARLEAVVAQWGGKLDPATVEVLEKNLGVIDRAIRESITALRSDPGNRFLENNLERAILAKGEYLREVAELTASST